MCARPSVSHVLSSSFRTTKAVNRSISNQKLVRDRRSFSINSSDTSTLLLLTPLHRPFSCPILSSSLPQSRPSRICFSTTASITTSIGATKTSPMSGMERVSTSGSAPPAAPYSQAIKANGQIWVSGQLHADETGKLIETSVTEKTALCCKNVKAILEAGGSSMDKIVRVGVFLIDMKDFAEMNEEYKKWFPHKPARACVAVHQLPLGATVEIEAIALA